MKKDEKIIEAHAVESSMRGYARPFRKIEIQALVENVRVPYVIDEAEYIRRIEERDTKRADEKKRQARLKAGRSK